MLLRACSQASGGLTREGQDGSSVFAVLRRCVAQSLLSGFWWPFTRGSRWKLSLRSFEALCCAEPAIRLLLASHERVTMEAQLSQFGGAGVLLRACSQASGGLTREGQDGRSVFAVLRRCVAQSLLSGFWWPRTRGSRWKLRCHSFEALKCCSEPTLLSSQAFEAGHVVAQLDGSSVPEVFGPGFAGNNCCLKAERLWIPQLGQLQARFCSCSLLDGLVIALGLGARLQQGQRRKTRAEASFRPATERSCNCFVLPAEDRRCSAKIRFRLWRGCHSKRMVASTTLPSTAGAQKAEALRTLLDSLPKAKKGGHDKRTARRKAARHLVFPVAPFERLAKETLRELSPLVKINPDALCTLQAGLEGSLERLFRDSQRSMAHAGRSTLWPLDLRLVRDIRNDDSLFWGWKPTGSARLLPKAPQPQLVASASLRRTLRPSLLLEGPTTTAEVLRRR